MQVWTQGDLRDIPLWTSLPSGGKRAPFYPDRLNVDLGVGELSKFSAYWLLSFSGEIQGEDRDSVEDTHFCLSHNLISGLSWSGACSHLCEAFCQMHTCEVLRVSTEQTEEEKEPWWWLPGTPRPTALWLFHTPEQLSLQHSSMKGGRATPGRWEKRRDKALTSHSTSTPGLDSPWLSGGGVGFSEACEKGLGSGTGTLEKAPVG